MDSSGSPFETEGTTFPTFRDGDVLITTITGRSWKLHSTTLRAASGSLRKLLDAHEPRTLSKKHMAEGKTIKWRLQMCQFEKDPGDTRFRSFSIVDPSKPKFVLPETLDGNVDPAYNKVYDNLFRCFYNLSPDFQDESIKHASFYVLDAISLLQAAESIDAAKAVRLIIEGHLLRLNQKLWSHIERNAEGWADIAIRLRSPVIFREAMVYIAGMWDSKDYDAKRAFILRTENGKYLTYLAEKKAKELKAKKILCERRILEYYPSRMIHSQNEPTLPGRSVYSGDIYLWQALVLVRQYMSSAFMANMHHRAKDGGVTFYRTIGAAGAAYIRSDTLDRFNENFAMTSKGRQCLEMAVRHVKDELRSTVAELLVDRTQINRVSKEKMSKYLTCTEISDEELPWVAYKKEQVEIAAKKAALASQLAVPATSTTTTNGVQLDKNDSNDQNEVVSERGSLKTNATMEE